MKKRMAAWLTCIICLSAFAAKADVPRFSIEEYPRVDGSTATLPLSYMLMAESTGVGEDQAKRVIRHTKTSNAFYELVHRNVDLLLVYEPSNDSYRYAREMGVALEMKPIGRDALVFLVNAENPVDTLTHDQVTGIYTGKISNWRQVGGADLPIAAYQRPEDSGSQVMMRRQVMGDTPMAEAPVVMRPGDMDMLVNEVAAYVNEPRAIGYSVYYYVSTMYIQDNIRLMAIDGIAPSNESITSGAYPYTQDFYAVIRTDASEGSPARVLYDWLGGVESATLLSDCGYVPVPAD